MPNSPGYPDGEIQPSIVKDCVSFRLAESARPNLSSTPSKLNACPTLPDANVAPFCSVPSLVPLMSCPLPSPGHQLTNPAGASTLPDADAARGNSIALTQTVADSITLTSNLL